MVERAKVVTVLRHAFPGASEEVVDAAATSIVGLSDEWQEVTHKEEELGYHYSPRCADICYLADQVENGVQFRLFRRRHVRSS